MGDLCGNGRGLVADLAPACQCAPPVAEKPFLVRQRIHAQSGRPPDASTLQAEDTPPGKVKLVMPGPCAGGKEGCCLPVHCQNGRAHVIRCFVAFLGNAGANNGVNILCLCAQCHHGVFCGLQHTRQRPPPPGMGRPHNGAISGAEQDRRTVGSNDRYGQIRPVGNKGIGLCAGAGGPGVGGCEYHAAMDLGCPQQVGGFHPKVQGDPAAVFSQIFWCVA